MINLKDNRLLRQKKMFLFDIDGTLVLGDKLLPGAGELITYLRENRIRFVLTTNNSTKGRDDYVRFFEEHDIYISPDEVMTAGILALMFCKENYSDKKIYMLSTPSLRRMFEEEGLIISDHYEEDIACVLVTFDTSLTYEKLEIASRILNNRNVVYIASNPDLCCPTMFGAIPDCGSICQMLKNSTGREPKFLGKPYPDIVNQCRKIWEIDTKDTVLVGDRIYTDMTCAENAGIDGVLVLSGEATDRDAQDCGLQIPFVFSSVKELYELIAGQ